jgi:hypothetical protein
MKAANHQWYGDTSPWTEQQLEDHTALNGRHASPSKQDGWKVVILDRENPPRPRPGTKTVNDYDAPDERRR